MVRGSHHRNDSLDRKFSVVDTGIVSHACSSKETLDKTSALVDRNGRPVILLRINKSVICSAGIPIFYEDEEVIGNVELNLTKPESIEEIIVSLRGIRKSLTGHPKVFVDVAERLWNASQVDQNTCCNSHTGDSHRVELKGYFNWPFCLKLPSQITAIDHPPGGSAGIQLTEQLPPSFSAPNSLSNIYYDVTVSVKGRHNFTLSSPFAYVPTIRPPCPAFPQGLGCNQDVDENVWDVFPSFTVRGTAFAAYTADVSCTIALPRPLYYTRGTSVLCALALEGGNENVLELLGRPDALCFQFRRYVEDLSSGLETKIARLWDAIKQPSTFISSATWSVADTNIADEQDLEIIGAVKALKSSMRRDAYSKILIGRIPLPDDLTPSFSFAKLSVKYEVQMLPFKAAGFVPEDGDKAIFFRTNINVASAPPIPLPPTRPGSAASSRSSSMHRQPQAQHGAISNCSCSSQSQLLPNRDASPRGDRSRIFDRPLPCPPRASRPERISSLGQAQSDAGAEAGSERSTLRRIATAPRVPPRAPFPSRHCTR